MTAFLKAGIPLNKLVHFKDLLEENNYRLADQRGMRDLIPLILKNEEDNIRSIINGNFLSVIFDGTTRLVEAFAIICRCVTDDFRIKQLLVRIQMSKSLCGEEIARELITVLSTTYSIKSHLILAAMRDRASVNNLAMQTVKVVYPNLVDIGCYSHTIDLVGGKFKTPTLSEFTSAWIFS